MAGLRDLPAMPAMNFLDTAGPAPDWNVDELNIATASEFQRGMKSSALANQAGGRMQAALEAARSGDHVTAARLKGEADDLAQQSSAWAPTTPSVSDVHDVGSGMRYVAGQAGAGLRSTLPSLGAAVAAGLVAKGLRIKSPIANMAIEGGAAAIPAYGMSKHAAIMDAANDPQAMQNNTPDQILGAATRTGAIDAGLQSIIPATVAGRTLGTVERAARPTLRGVAGMALRDAGVQAGVQGATTLVGQQSQEALDPNRDSSHDLKDLVDAAVSGAVTAPMLGGHTYALEAARAVAANVRESAAAPKPSVPQPGAQEVGQAGQDGGIPLQAPPVGGIPLDGSPPANPMAFAAEDQPGAAPMSSAKASWLQRQNERAPADVSAQGGGAVMDWLKGQDNERNSYVGDALNSAGAGAADLAQRFKDNASGTYNEAVDYLTKNAGAQRAKSAVQDLATAGQDFYKGLTGQKQNDQYDPTDRALFDLFHKAIPDNVAHGPDAVVAADMLRRFAKGNLDPKMGQRVARTMLEAYGEDALPLAAKAAQILQRGGVEEDKAAQLPKLVQSMLGDDEGRHDVLTKGIDPLISNDARESFKQSFGRELGSQDLGRIAQALDRTAAGDTQHVEGLHELFGDKLQQAVNVARATHDAAHRDVSSFLEAMGGKGHEEEGDDSGASKAVEKSSPTIYSFADGEGKNGIGKPFDMSGDVEKVQERQNTLERLYPGSTVDILPAEQYAREAGVTPEALGSDLKGKAVLRVQRPTNEDPLSFDRDTVKKLVKPTAITRDMRAGDEARDERYTVRTNRDGKQYTEVRRPGVDEGAFYVALNKNDGTPLVANGKRRYGMVRTDDLVREMAKRDAREGITTGEDNGAQKKLQHLLAGLTSLATAEHTNVDGKAGLVFMSPDGKKSKVLFDGTPGSLPDQLKVGNSTVGELRKAANDEIAERAHQSLIDQEQDKAPAERNDTDPTIREDKGQSRILGEAGLAEPPPEGTTTHQGESAAVALGREEARKHPEQLGLGTQRVTADDRRPEGPTTTRKGPAGGAAGEGEPGRLDSFQRALGKDLRRRNDQAANDRPLTDEERKGIEDYAHRVLGPDVKVSFEEHLGSAGEWTSDDTGRVMKIAITTGVNGMSVAQHEAMHGFMEYLMKHGHADVVDTLRAAAGATTVRKQLERLLVTEPAALRQLGSPEERAAYMYQFWEASKAGLVDFRVGPQTEGVLSKISAFIKKTLGFVSANEKVDALLQAFHDGKMTEPSAVDQVIAEMRAKHPEKWPALKTMVGASMRKMSGWFSPAYNALANSGNGTAAKIGELFYTDPTSDNPHQGFIQARQQQAATWLNHYGTILEGVKPEDLVAARDVLQGKTVKVTGADQARVVNLSRQMLDKFYGYMKEAGVDVRRRRNYFPRVWDMDKIVADAGGFRKDLLDNHQADLENLGQLAYKAAKEQYENEILNGRNATAPDERDYSAEKTAEHIVATLSTQHGYVADDIEPGKAKINENSARPGFTPFMAAVNSRTLDFLDMKVFGKYLKDDMVNVMSTYINQGVRRAEYARRFGNDGSKLAGLMSQATEEEASRVRAENPSMTKAQVAQETAARTAQYAKSIMAMEGTLGYDISPTMRRINSGMVVYQNLRLLPLSIFSSLIDPMGIMVRGGTVTDSFNAFKRGVADLTRGLHSDGDGQDHATKLAEMMGTVENKVLLDSLGESYSSVYLYGWARKMNDTFFKWNGMEGWNRAMRVAATQAAFGFIGRHAKGENAQHSTRWLRELGLTSDDVKFNPDGSVKVFTEEGLSSGEAAKMRVAVQRFVDTAILRPNAAQRPAWASDPHYALLFHLKQFTYSFHNVILKRAAHEWKNGNLTPAMVLASYVPFMVAADLARGAIQGGGSQPDWKKDWTLGDYVSSGIQRAGLLGVGQFALDAKYMGVGALGGPAVEQVTSAAQDPAYNTFVRALPANPAYRDMMLHTSAKPQRSQRDISDLTVD